MSWIASVIHGLKALVASRRRRQDTDDEIAQFIEDARREFVERGMAQEAAQRAARVAFGSPAAARDALMTKGWESVVRAIATDAAYGARTLLRARWFTTSTVATLALGIGLTTTLFSVAYGLLLRPLPWTEADRLVRLEERRGGQIARATRWTVTNGFYHAWAAIGSPTVQTVGGWMASHRTVIDEAGSERILTASVTPSVFEALGTAPALGRTFVDADVATGGAGVALISHGLWQERFGGDPRVVGRPLRLDDRAYQVVGVLPRAFAFPDEGTRVWTAFRPLTLLSGDGRQIRLIHVNMLALLRPGASASQAASEATAVAQTVPDIGRRAALALFGSDGEITIDASPVLDVLLAETKPAVTFLFVAVGLLLAAATASVASMQLARATARRREMAVRLAIGASRGRLVQQWLVESAILGVSAGGVGAGVACFLHAATRSMLGGAFPRVDDVRLDVTVWLFAGAMTLVVSAVCGLVPALLVARQRLTGSLLADRGEMGALSQRIRVGHLRMSILGGQVAVACVLVVAAGVLTRSFTAMATTDRGYDADNVLTARLNFQHSVAPTRRIEMLESIQQHLAASPDILRVGFGNGLPLLHIGNVFSQSIPSPRDPATPMAVSATWRVVSPEYMEALRLRVIAGRLLTPADTAFAPPVMIVNRSFAASYLGDAAVGQRLPMRVGTKGEWEVVGVVEDVRQGDLSSPERPAFFVSYRQAPESIAFDPVLVMRTRNAPANHAARVADIVHRADGSLVADSVMSFQDRVRASLARPRTYAFFALSVAALALGLSGVGLFGVLAYVTSQRTHELGIRMALGARSVDLLTVVMRPIMLAVGAGALGGLLVSFVLLRMLASVLYGVTTHDVLSYATATLAIVVTTVMAGVVPARRVIGTNPTVALRS